MLKICLYHLEQACLLVPANTGTTYFFMAGSSSEPREQEGFLVPISNDFARDAEGAASLADQLNRQINTSLQINRQTAQHIDELLLQLSSNDRISVDRTRLPEAAPGCIPVQITTAGEYSLISGIETANALLLWPSISN